MKNLLLITGLMCYVCSAYCQQTLYKINDNETREQQFRNSHRNKELDKFALLDVAAATEITGYDMILKKTYYQGITVVSEQTIFRKAEYKYGIFLLHRPVVKRMTGNIYYDTKDIGF